MIKQHKMMQHHLVTIVGPFSSMKYVDGRCDVHYVVKAMDRRSRHPYKYIGSVGTW